MVNIGGRRAIWPPGARAFEPGQVTDACGWISGTERWARGAGLFRLFRSAFFRPEQMDRGLGARVEVPLSISISLFIKKKKKKKKGWMGSLIYHCSGCSGCSGLNTYLVW